ncbi:FAD/NAD(P)-binding domain-containing protein [Choiromyces venosus 120613-1]|uniref:Kynurenine 3-monooxygenase n=1 Tax=Choiromyces venosus 120613-1 TaxID=1336337 RepID=A0A3N4JFE9_9PEZI|nr:FAD/NAD(P)-binding domain-containing protein [Choiromyces venosus 120613-1]
MDSESPATRKKVIVVGAGPVGALAALYFSHAGWEVEVYELRGVIDLRLPENLSLNFSKSINLALSERGINGLKNLGDGGKLLEEVLSETIPMYGRMIHTGVPGEKGESQKYDVHGNFIRSADRARLNVQLLDALALKDVKLFFHHGLRGLNLDANTAEFEKKDGSGEKVTVHADLIVGADGAHSATRRLLQKSVRMYYEQIYIETLWQEYEIPPHKETGDFKIDANHLHIWPKKDFMFIAIPSIDKTFTCTLFMEQWRFDAIGESKEDLLAFFKENFEEVIDLVGEESLVEQYMNHQKLPLISIKCRPYHYKDRCVIIGDAAHAMVPFYGQGMNAGFEDVSVLFEHINENPGSMADALDSYSAYRVPDGHMINELAMQNHIEMRSAVTSKTYLLRKAVEEALYAHVPWLGVRTMYSMVSFSNIRYTEVVERARRQRMWLNVTGAGLLVMGSFWGIKNIVRMGIIWMVKAGVR